MLWLKIIHIIFMVSWFAGLFYLPRLFVYHAESRSEDVSKTLAVMERRLYWGIMTPAMILTFLSGLWMIHAYAYGSWGDMYWLWIKLALAVLLLLYHVLLNEWRKSFLGEGPRHSSRFFRWVNEIPLLFLVVMTALVILKPF